MNIKIKIENEGETQELVGRPKKRIAEVMSEAVKKESEEPVAKRRWCRPPRSTKGWGAKGGCAKKKVKNPAGSRNKVKHPAGSDAILLVSPTAAALSSSFKTPATSTPAAMSPPTIPNPPVQAAPWTGSEHGAAGKVSLSTSNYVAGVHSESAVENPVRKIARDLNQGHMLHLITDNIFLPDETNMYLPKVLGYAEETYVLWKTEKERKAEETRKEEELQKKNMAIFMSKLRSERE
ncbi:hypothetical protein BDK51DRAFT_33073 [Blyttiomyces helicus]|uniref:Uncharacterized protein n=1 Tax=Blyttiomyces helicus TaxID=388810 RepID=A0A4P9WR60_9FUNG|nr:hypothetical protein BDK51DRAFT_33073 [Blyttiomyces helicus]|eukprot:RKO94703.1 hypothetical protein BDK51DRAFT_33073 [Blyttiomyces helicus]